MFPLLPHLVSELTQLYGSYKNKIHLFAQYIVFALGVPDFKTTFSILVILVEAKLPEGKLSKTF